MDNRDSYRANQPYKYSYTEDSRSCIVPPPETTHEDRRVLLQLPHHDNQAVMQHDLYGNPEFIAALARAYDLRAEYTISAWVYDQRHTAQEVLPFMLLGPMSFARDLEKVQRAGISMMVAVRSRKISEARPAIMDPAKFASAQGIRTATFDVDTPFDIITRRSSILKQINDHLESTCDETIPEQSIKVSGKVLVFCETGNERSPVLPALYLMTMWGLDAFSAVQVVQARRFGIGLSPEMIAMLQDVQQILDAERQVAAVPKDSALPRASSRKRNIDEAYEEFRGLQIPGNEEEREHTRIGTSPFSDRHG